LLVGALRTNVVDVTAATDVVLSRSGISAAGFDFGLGDGRGGGRVTVRAGGEV
jgi:hypothetical protein